jgi:hypothetical protein
VDAIWASGPTTLTVTGNILLSKNGGAYSASSLPIVDGDTLSIIWNNTAISAAGDGVTLTGSFQDSVYKNDFSITIDRSATGLAFADLSQQALNSSVTSDSINLVGHNVPVSLTLSPPSTNPLLSVKISVNGGNFFESPQSINPGDSVQLQAITGGTTSTSYSVNVSAGSGPPATDVWSVSTVSALPVISTPSITSPANNSTDINPEDNDPVGITLVGSTYSALNGAGAQTSSTWEVYRALEVPSSTASITTATIDSFNVSANNLSNGGNNIFLSEVCANYVRPIGASCGINVIGSIPVKLGDKVGICGNNSSGRWQMSGFNCTGFPAGNGSLWSNLAAYSLLETTATGNGCITLIYSNNGEGGSDSGIGGVYINGEKIVNGQGLTTLNLSNSNCLNCFSIGNRVCQSNGAATGVVYAVDTINSALTLCGVTGTWTSGQTAINLDVNEAIVAPTADPPGANYVAIPGSPYTVSSAPYTALNVASSAFLESSTYFARVQYATTNTSVATSCFSNWSGFSTASNFNREIGIAYKGGFYAGQINDLGTIYNLIVSPTTSGTLCGAIPAPGGPTNLAWRTSDQADGPEANSEQNGTVATTAFANNPQYPVFYWIGACAQGPNAGNYQPVNGNQPTGTGIGGYNDWYLPALDELKTLYWYFKPSNELNNTSSGYNNHAVAPEPVGQPYTALSPAQTSVPAFQTGGQQAFSTADSYLTATQNAGSPGNVWTIFFRQGCGVSLPKTDTYRGAFARVIRREAA